MGARLPHTPAADGQAYYRRFLSLFVFYSIFLRMKPKVLFAFPVMRSMLEFQDGPLEMSTPKSFALVTTSRIWPCKVYTVLIAFLAVDTPTTWHLEGLNSMSHWDSHNDSLSRSFCSTVPSSKPPIVRWMYTAVSSAESRTCHDSFSGRSFMNTWNRIGPKTESWGTIELTGTDPDSSPSITTVCNLLPWKARIQDSAFPLMPYWWSF